MSLFNFGKKKEEKNTPVCTCNCGCSTDITTNFDEQHYSDIKQGKIYCIKVLGTGCKSCRELYENIKQAVNNIGLDIVVDYITDIQQIVTYGAMSMPAMVVNDKVVSMGKVLKITDIENLLRKLGVK